MAKELRGVAAEEHQMLVDMTRDQVMDEDYTVLKTTRPRLSAQFTEELLVETDRTLAQVRKITQEYAVKAGEIDTVALAALANNHIHVIPCPGHKADPKNWVHKTVPLKNSGIRDELKAVS